MDDSSSDIRHKTSRDSRSPSDDSLNELRKLLLEPIQSQLDELQQRLDIPELHAKDISRALPEAIALRSAQDKKLEISLEPITAKSIHTSIRKDRKVLVDALFPVMGPAIRKAIFSVIQGMVQTLNQLLEHSFSMRGLKWRLEALRTRKPFAEVILLKTLVYHVEQVFLIHRKTGLVLQHVVAKSVVGQDPDLVSGMLTAIKDFVQDSFGADDGEGLETLRVGERSIWIEQGRHAILAAVVRGNPPLDYQMTLGDALDEIHFSHHNALESFVGDTEPFEGVEYILNDCLKYQLKQEKKKTSFLLWLFLAAFVLLIGAWLFLTFKNNRIWSDYIDKLQAEPGIVITEIDQRSGKYHIFGLLDPLASDPQQMLKDAGLNSAKVVFRWEPYFSRFPQYALQRIQKILSPPESVKLEFKDGILHARGSALNRWLVDTRKMVNAFPWITSYHDDDVRDINQHMQPPQNVILKIKGNQLNAIGSADHRWILRARKLVKTLDGITALREDNLIDTDVVSFDKARAELDNRIIYFKLGSDSVLDNQQDAIRNLVQNVKAMHHLAELLNKKIFVEIIGHSDSRGSENIRMEISRQRSEKILMILVAEGIPPDFLRATGIGTQNPVKEEMHESDMAFNRSATFKVIPVNVTY
jgi:OOP family OmpA-OmpF porin